MALSAISNVPLSKNSVTQQQSETVNKQLTDKGTGLTSDKNSAGNTFNDNVSLSQVKNVDISQALDAAAAEKKLPETIKNILAESRTAVAAQANISPETAQVVLDNE